MTTEDKAPIGPATAALEGFVRGTLGCRCPAEVFQCVEEAPTAASRAAGVAQRIAIGGRLLVYLVRPPSDDMPGAAAKRMRAWVAAGLAERDGSAMNRLRIVVVLDRAAAPLRDELKAAFAALRPGGDERLHLHLIDAVAAAAVLPSDAAPPT